jgi:hypothetical protein
MSRLRITQIELEDAGEDLIRVAFDALGSFTREPHPQIERPAIAPAIAAPPLQPSAIAPVKAEKRLTGKRQDAPAPLRQASGGGDTIPARILEALRGKPMSSLELAEKLKLQPQQVYPATSLLKTKGALKSENDPADGTRRWYVAG